MGIDFESETIITLGEACRAFPPSGVSGATMARWIQRGIKVKSLGSFVKLETLVIGGRRLTSREAIARFIAAQNANDVPAVPVITASQRRRQAQAAQTQLETMGVRTRDAETSQRAKRRAAQDAAFAAATQQENERRDRDRQVTRTLVSRNEVNS